MGPTTLAPWSWDGEISSSSPSPQRGPEASHRMSLAIFISDTASVFNDSPSVLSTLRLRGSVVERDAVCAGRRMRARSRVACRCMTPFVRVGGPRTRATAAGHLACKRRRRRRPPPPASRAVPPNSLLRLHLHHLCDQAAEHRQGAGHGGSVRWSALSGNGAGWGQALWRRGVGPAIACDGSDDVRLASQRSAAAATRCEAAIRSAAARGAQCGSAACHVDRRWACMGAAMGAGSSLRQRCGARTTSRQRRRRHTGSHCALRTTRRGG